ncbi:hypothetical protein GCM10008107_18930 [Psychrosphaera saromensis]|uniref:RDD family protein n=1 Tax=Psychrosphaera saromensis TaxID=716813 RepID=A0A2S7URK4_9GAMM|nr:RDD family protein [Psychrosphaera saromensis]PQJ52606.1 RDD family protein [Psychrosphaera saromensis]GHB69791.1 hypothetical protein GCM10008107_18930 [Psychrosphaera saromensis]GLQ13078.1 hypothetical protein GCM10007917_05330 [Psychrosphaera saromensis]
MDSNVDFSNYSLEELHSSAASIDRDLYPERAKLIDDLILQKQQQPENQGAPIIEGDLASRGHRFAAAIVDGLIAIIVSLPMIFYVGLEKLQEETFEVMALSFLYGLTILLILHGYLLYNYAQTIGKHYMGIRVENLDGTQATFSTILLKRMLPMQVISFIPGVGSIIAGFVDPLFIFGKDKRCLHDYIAKTKVCYVDGDTDAEKAE